MNNIPDAINFHFPSGNVECFLDRPWQEIKLLFPGKRLIIITDENLFGIYKNEFDGFDVVVIPPGEQSKKQETIDFVINELLEIEVDKGCILVGIGGGVVSDITGFVAAIYKRGLQHVLVPTSLMGMADAAIGGKNGINAGQFKNVIGTIYQPIIILYDYSFLKSLPLDEWRNGIAEIIKHACICDPSLFKMLEMYELHQLQSDVTLTASLIEKSLQIKMNIVTEDESDHGNRRILNFGHTIGHAVERMNDLPHGHAISIGMVAACGLSEKYCGLHFSEAARIVKLLARYHLPVDVETDYMSIISAIRTDKKRSDTFIHFILIEKIGKAIIHPIEIAFLEKHLNEFL